MTFDYPEGATPLDPDTMEGLIPGLTTQGELNAFEARNIASALQWALRSRTLKRDLYTSSGLILLHKRMFNITWRWAGQFRKRETNIGVNPTQIPIALAALCGDVAYQVEHHTPIPPPNLVLIYPFVGLGAFLPTETTAWNGSRLSLVPLLVQQERYDEQKKFFPKAFSPD